MKFRRLLFVGLIFFILHVGGCTSKKFTTDSLRHMTATELLYQGTVNLKKENYTDAIRYLESIDALYPFSPEVDQGQLAVIYAYHQTGNSNSALAAATRYIHLHPESSHTDYAYYMKGIINLSKDRIRAQKILTRKLEDLDISLLNEAFIYFSELIKKFPRSIYAHDAQTKMFYIKHTIAEHELNIAKFYLKREAHVAAANRAIYIVKHFKNIPQLKDALKIMIHSYDALGLTEFRDNTIEAFRFNFPKDNLREI